MTGFGRARSRRRRSVATGWRDRVKLDGKVAARACPRGASCGVTGRRSVGGSVDRGSFAAATSPRVGSRSAGERWRALSATCFRSAWRASSACTFVVAAAVQGRCRVVSALCQTRLETRTEELSTGASRWAREPQRRSEGKRGVIRRRTVAGATPARVAGRCDQARSKSVRAQTRKVVNYAWAGRSQRKL